MTQRVPKRQGGPPVTAALERRSSPPLWGTLCDGLGTPGCFQALGAGRAKGPRSPSVLQEKSPPNLHLPWRTTAPYDSNNCETTTHAKLARNHSYLLVLMS